MAGSSKPMSKTAKKVQGKPIGYKAPGMSKAKSSNMNTTRQSRSR